MPALTLYFVLRRGGLPEMHTFPEYLEADYTSRPGTGRTSWPRSPTRMGYGTAPRQITHGHVRSSVPHRPPSSGRHDEAAVRRFAGAGTVDSWGTRFPDPRRSAGDLAAVLRDPVTTHVLEREEHMYVLRSTKAINSILNAL